MSNASPSKEKFCSLISEIIGKSTDIIVEKENVLDYDAVELTLLLKSIGFQLTSLDFDSTPTEGARDIEIEIRCKQSGIHSKLLMSADKCTCPTRKSVNNNSFWEVQGIAPSTPVDKNKGIVQDTSCNLLPDVSRKTTNLAKTMMTVLLQHYQADFEPKGEQIKTVDVNQLVERLQEKIVNEKCRDLWKVPNNLPPTELSEQSTVSEKYSESPNDKVHDNSDCSPPLGSINITPVPSPNDNTTNIAKRDVCVIQAITDARKQLDAALLMLKCNITRTLSQDSLLTVTPQLTKKPPTPNKESIFLRTTNRRLSVDDTELRRHSYGVRQELKPKMTTGGLKTSSSSGSVNDIKKKALNLPLTGKIAKKDSPRTVSSKKLTTIGGRPPVVSKTEIKRTTSATSLKTTLKNSVKVPVRNNAKNV